MSVGIYALNLNRFKMMSLEEFEQLIKEKNITPMVMMLALGNRGYVTVREEEYENLQVINEDDPCP